MPRRRILAPEFFESEKLGVMDDWLRLLFVGLISNSDDYGKGRANATLLRNYVWAFNEKPTAAQVQRGLKILQRSRKIYLWKDGDLQYYQLPRWQFWNRVDNPLPSHIPNVPKGTVWARSVVSEGLPRGQRVPVEYLTPELQLTQNGRDWFMKKYGEPISQNVSQTASQNTEAQHQGPRRRQDERQDENENEKKTKPTSPSQISPSSSSTSSLEREDWSDKDLRRYQGMVSEIKELTGWDRNMQQTWIEAQNTIDFMGGGMASILRLLKSCRKPGVKNATAKFISGLKGVCKEFSLSETRK